MSENSLELRNKFITKINKKIKDLNDNIALLAKVDNKIFKNSNSQFGGGNDFNRIKNINRHHGGAPNDTNKALVKIMTSSLKAQKAIELLKQVQHNLTNMHEVVDTISKQIPEELDITDITKEINDLGLGENLRADDIKLIYVLYNNAVSEGKTKYADFIRDYPYPSYPNNTFNDVINRLNAKKDTTGRPMYQLNNLLPGEETRLTEELYEELYRGFYNEDLEDLANIPNLIDVNDPLRGLAIVPGGLAAAAEPAGQKYRRYY